MNTAAKIPIPPAQRWKEFRIRFLPPLCFFAALILALIVWSEYVFPAPLVGRVEAIQTAVASPKPGLLTQLRVARFQKVKAGDPIVDVITTAPNVMIASLGVIRADIELLRTTMAPAVNFQRNLINYEQARTDWMRQRVDLATAKVNLVLATSEYQRTDSLYKEKIVSSSVYETCKTTMDALRTEVEERTKLVEAAQINLDKLRQVNELAKEPENQLTAAIAVQEQKLKLAEAEMKPVTLHAPISGVVQLIQKFSGETVLAGEAIVSVSAEHTDRIVGYLRQPIYVEPKVDMDVLVRTRRLDGQTGWGKIVAVGAQLQPINDALLPPTRIEVVEQGLPILVSLPQGFRVHPGEFVDLRIRPR